VIDQGKMGQSLISLSHLIKFSGRLFGLFVVLLFMSGNSGFLVNGQNCDFTTDVNKDGEVWIIEGSPVSEKSTAGSVIWNVKTTNIQGSGSSPIPHGRYLRGLRYSSSYVYQASEYLHEFVNTESSTVIHRNVTFTCAEGGNRRVHFRFPLLDENESPRFTKRPNTDLQVVLKDATRETILNENQPIEVLDPDFRPENNNVWVASDRRELILTDFVQSDEQPKIGRLFTVRLKLNLTGGHDSIPIGRYSVNLICSDGTFTNSTNIGINIK